MMPNKNDRVIDLLSTTNEGIPFKLDDEAFVGERITLVQIDLAVLTNQGYMLTIVSPSLRLYQVLDTWSDAVDENIKPIEESKKLVVVTANGLTYVLNGLVPIASLAQLSGSETTYEHTIYVGSYIWYIVQHPMNLIN